MENLFVFIYFPCSYICDSRKLKKEGSTYILCVCGEREKERARVFQNKRDAT